MMNLSFFNHVAIIITEKWVHIKGPDRIRDLEVHG